MAEVVYLIGAPDSGRVKIGRTINVGQRLAAIQRMCPIPLEVRSTFHGGCELETALHRHFKADRVYGEWFDLGEDPVQRVVDAVVAIEEQRIEIERQKAMLEDVRLASRRLDEALAKRHAARVVLAAAVTKAADGGVGSTMLTQLTGKSAETIRQWSRERGVERRRPPTSGGFKKAQAKEADA